MPERSTPPRRKRSASHFIANYQLQFSQRIGRIEDKKDNDGGEAEFVIAAGGGVLAQENLNARTVTEAAGVCMCVCMCVCICVGGCGGVFDVLTLKAPDYAK